MDTRTRTIGMLTITALAASACGSTTKFANKTRPPLPVNLTVYINSARVSVSPVSLGGGPAVLIITNQTGQAEGLSIVPSGASGSSDGASTAPINPQGTAEVSVQLQPHTDYTLSATGGGPDGQQSSIAPASISVAAERSSSRGALLYP